MRRRERRALAAAQKYSLRMTQHSSMNYRGEVGVARHIPGAANVRFFFQTNLHERMCVAKENLVG